MKVEFDNFDLNKTMFCYVVWMRDYCGADGDAPRNWGEWGDKQNPSVPNDTPETFNFKEYDGYYYGHFRLVNRTTKNLGIAKLGAGNADDKISGVTVIWTSARGEDESGVVDDYYTDTRVIGWYKNATVYREKQTHRNSPYWVRVAVKDGCLLPMEKRMLRVLHTPRTFTPAIMYGCNAKDSASNFLERLDKCISKTLRARATKPPLPTVAARTQNAEKRKAIEKAAVDFVRAHYEAGKWRVRSVESENCGWDLTVRNDTNENYVEVKGREKNSIKCELSSNEYAKARTKSGFLLAVVTCALTNPRLRIFKPTLRNRKVSWECIDGDPLEINTTEVPAAIIAQKQ